MEYHHFPKEIHPFFHCYVRIPECIASKFRCHRWVPTTWTKCSRNPFDQIQLPAKIITVPRESRVIPFQSVTIYDTGTWTTLNYTDRLNNVFQLFQLPFPSINQIVVLYFNHHLIPQRIRMKKCPIPWIYLTWIWSTTHIHTHQEQKRLSSTNQETAHLEMNNQKVSRIPNVVIDIRIRPRQSSDGIFFW